MLFPIPLTAWKEGDSERKVLKTKTSYQSEYVLIVHLLLLLKETTYFFTLECCHMCPLASQEPKGQIQVTDTTTPKDVLENNKGFGDESYQNFLSPTLTRESV